MICDSGTEMLTGPQAPGGGLFVANTRHPPHKPREGSSPVVLYVVPNDGVTPEPKAGVRPEPKLGVIPAPKLPEPKLGMAPEPKLPEPKLPEPKAGVTAEPKAALLPMPRGTPLLQEDEPGSILWVGRAAVCGGGGGGWCGGSSSPSGW